MSTMIDVNLVDAEVTKPRPFEVRNLEATDSLSMLRGTAVPYDTPTDIGWFMEEFAPGSLAKSINKGADRRLRQGKGLPLLLMHDDRSLPIGVSTEWIETPKGLDGVWRLSEHPRAQEAAQLVKDEMLNHLSIRFAPELQEWTYADPFDPDLGPRYKHKVRRTQARLLEVSLVSTPAYANATVQLVRSAQRLRPGRKADKWREYLETIRDAR